MKVLIDTSVWSVALRRAKRMDDPCWLIVYVSTTSIQYPCGPWSETLFGHAHQKRWAEGKFTRLPRTTEDSATGQAPGA